MIADKKTIGLTPDNRAIIEDLVQQKFFKEQIDAAKFALSVAINNQIQLGSAEGAETIWNVGSFDTDGNLKSLINSLYPEIDTPYRLVEYFINAGLQIIQQKYPDKRTMSNMMELVDSKKAEDKLPVKE